MMKINQFYWITLFSDRKQILYYDKDAGMSEEINGENITSFILKFIQDLYIFRKFFVLKKISI